LIEIRRKIEPGHERDVNPPLIGDEYEVGAASRAARDEPGPLVNICDRCGMRESLYGYEPSGQIPLVEWPLSVEQLLEEERDLLARERASGVARLSLDELDQETDDDD
jgi:hypothetical protein